MVPGAEFDDLIGEGCVGLIRAVDSYDASRGPALDQYASRIIAGAMLNGLRKLDPVSERVRKELRDAERERYLLASRTGVLPTQAEMEGRRPMLRRATINAYRNTPLSLDGPLPAGERLSTDWDADPAVITGDRGERETIHIALHRLPERQRHVLRLHYFNGQSLHQIGNVLQISPQRASQLHQAALKNLRKVMHAAY
jgi:RNA polymerase sigma factor for flagellar operon FliA